MKHSTANAQLALQRQAEWFEWHNSQATGESPAFAPASNKANKEANSIDSRMLEVFKEDLKYNLLKFPNFSEGITLANTNLRKILALPNVA